MAVPAPQWTAVHAWHAPGPMCSQAHICPLEHIIRFAVVSAHSPQAGHRLCIIGTSHPIARQVEREAGSMSGGSVEGCTGAAVALLVTSFGRDALHWLREWRPRVRTPP